MQTSLPSETPSAVEPGSVDDSRREWIRRAILIVVPLVVYLNSLNGAFLFDDWIMLENYQTRDLSLANLFSSARNRPIAYLSFAMNFATCGEDPWSYHIVNVTIHLLAGLLLYGIIRRTLLLPSVPISENTRTQAAWLAFAIALLWLLHPLQTSAVTYIVQRMESLMALFFLLTLYLVLRGANSAASIGWYSAACVTAFLGMGTKQVMIAAPLVILAFDRNFLAMFWKEILRRRGIVYACFIGMMIYGSYQVWPSLFSSEKTELASAGFSLKSISKWEYFRSQPGVILHYLRLVFWPDPLVFDYGWPVATIREAIIPGLIVSAMFVASIACLFVRPAIGFLGISFFLILAPTSSFMPIQDLAFEHRMYLPLAIVLTLVVLAVWKVGQWSVQKGKLEAATVPVVLTGLLVCIALIFSIRTISRNNDYATPVRMWETVVETAPHHVRAHYQLGLRLEETDAVGAERAENLRRAKECYQQAIALDPDYIRAHTNLGRINLITQDYPEAIRHYQKAVELAPYLTFCHVNIGQSYLRQDLDARAIPWFEKALEHSEKESEIRDASYFRGIIAMRAENFETARTYLERSSSIGDPQTDTLFNLAKTYMALEKKEQAAQTFAAFLKQSSPGDPKAQAAMKWLYDNSYAHLIPEFTR